MRPNSLLVTRLGARQVVLCILFVAAHAVVTTVAASHAELVSNLFMAAAAILASCACLRAARAVGANARPGWIFVCLAMLVWSVADIVSIVVDLVHGTPSVVAGIPDFLFFFYDVALLLAVTWTEDDALGGKAFWFDGLQATLATFLAYIAIFNVVPFSSDHIQPVGAALLVPIYDIENTILVLLAVLRLVGRAPSPARWAFDRSMLVFTIVYGIVASIYNHYLADTSGFRDAIIDIPFLALAATACGPDPSRRQGSSRRSMVAILVDSAGPVFFTSMVLAFGAMVVPRHPALGVCSIVVALAIYGFRAALLQSLYVRAQEDLRDARDHLERLSLEDGLTGLANRRHFDHALCTGWDRAERSGQPLSLILLDVDHFKNLNDQQGHQAGDDCLVRIAAALRANVTRRVDLAARYGGEEFAILLPDTDLAGSLLVADLIRTSIDRLQIPNDGGAGGLLTVSMGVACTRSTDIPTARALIDAADRALYAAKKGGRDRIVPASSQAHEVIAA